jgi:hypothetical protein
MKKITESIKRKCIKLYTKSKLFRNLANSLGIGMGSSFFYGMTGGTCPCCGKSASTCAVGLGALGFIGFFFGILSFVFLSIKDFYEKIRVKLTCKEKK